MAKKTTLQLQIDNPCQEKWDTMTTESARQRYCGQCQKSVIDFTQMSDGQIVHYVSSSKGSICGRLRADQLQRPLTLLHPERASWRKLAALVAALGLWGGHLLAQNNYKAATATSIHVDTDTRLRPKPVTTRLISGFVSDQQTGELLVGASIGVMGTRLGTVTSEDGYFQLEVPTNTTELTISYMGYIAQTVTLTEQGIHLEISLKAGVDLEAVVVTASSFQTREIYSGGLLFSQVHEIEEEKASEKKAEEKKICYLQAAAISPNPSRLPPRLTIDSPLTHELRLQLFDASGQLLWQDEWEIIPGHNQHYISSNWNNWPNGTYFLALEDEEDQKQMLTLVKQ